MTHYHLGYLTKTDSRKNRKQKLHSIYFSNLILNFKISQKKTPGQDASLVNSIKHLRKKKIIPILNSENRERDHFLIHFMKLN